MPAEPEILGLLLRVSVVYIGQCAQWCSAQNHCGDGRDYLLWIAAYLPDKMPQELPAEQKWAFVWEQEVGIIELTIKTKLLDTG